MKYPTTLPDAALARLHASYIVETTGCWRWTRSKTTAGYGHFHVGGHYYQAHRLLYVLTRGPVTTTAMDHLCRNRWCVNPAHLEPVSHRENIRRGRGTRLTPAKVREVRDAVAAGGSYRAVGRAFGIDHSTVCRIVTGSRWADVPAEKSQEAA